LVTSMYACGVTITGLINRKKKNAPINDDTARSPDAGNRRRISDRICLQIHRIPYGVLSRLLIIASIIRPASVVSLTTRGRITAINASSDTCTFSSPPLRLASSSCTISGLISRSIVLYTSIIWLISGATTALRYACPGPRRVYVVISRRIGVFARNKLDESDAVSNCAASTI
ncbi:hypothetical protein AX774_g2930, partial [Zancudomyces culisetae]